MEAPKAAKSLAALGHEGRLMAFRLLVEAGPGGLPAGEIARRTGVLQNTSSSNLNVLAAAGLVASRRDGRSIIYSVSHEHFGELMEYLVQDCCGGRPDLCAPFFARLLESCSAGGPYEGRGLGADRNNGDCC
ncbi:MAG: helix-turn-helix transcriptional regulator [Phenylobacterium sp.]|uniref:ArsR/SmtB family transcription factor n=1 Tax=Phenylobacterium sp. TaxID=1871053 RepID=UPI001A4B2138|nr:helix-turn-helix transcriptional regulator [Phenylobacterium sp.]MBL8554368.1 helix-turn-helix transcriptional regulator [Phenylobacterium sp.]